MIGCCSDRVRFSFRTYRSIAWMHLCLRLAIVRRLNKHPLGSDRDLLASIRMKASLALSLEQLIRG